MTEKKKSFSIVQLITALFVICIAAASGMYFGSSFNNATTENINPDSFDTFRDLKLLPDSTFPDVQLLDKNAHFVNSQSMLHKKESIILFIDSECPPCHDIADYWQNMINQQKILNEQIIAISFNDYGYLEDFIDSSHITFSVYTDPDFTFMQTFGVDAYPLTMYVNADGIITKIFTNSNYIQGK